MRLRPQPCWCSRSIPDLLDTERKSITACKKENLEGYSVDKVIIFTRRGAPFSAEFAISPDPLRGATVGIVQLVVRTKTHEPDEEPLA